MFQTFCQLYKNYFKGFKETKQEKVSERTKRTEVEPGGNGTDNKIKDLEKQISRLLDQNKELQSQVNYSRCKECEFQKVLSNYDDLLGTMVVEKNHLTRQNSNMKYHLVNLEKAFYDLLQKYERAKAVIQGFQSNEAILRKQVSDYERIVESLNEKWDKICSENHLLQGGKEVVTKNKKLIVASSDDAVNKRQRLLTTI